MVSPVPYRPGKSQHEESHLLVPYDLGFDGVWKQHFPAPQDVWLTVSMLSQLPPLWDKYARCSLLDLVLCMSADAGSILCLPALGQKSGILLICADRISVVLHAPCGRDWGPFGWVLMGLAGWQLQQLGAVGYLSTSQAWSVSIDSYS